MSDLKTMESALAQAKAAYTADKTNKALKKAYKAAKKALAAAQAEAEAKKAKKKSKKNKKRKRESKEAEEPVKKTKTDDLESLTAAAAAAKAAYKADKKNAALKAAHKATKAALAAFTSSTSSTAPMETEATKEEETKAPESNPLDDLKKTPAAPASTDPHNNPPNPVLFCGNLSWQIEEATLKDFFKDCGTITNINWLEDKETGKFLGRGFATFDSTESATKAMELSGQECMGRDIRLGYAKPRSNNRAGGGSGKNGQRFVEKPLSARPDGCFTAFVGNVSFEIDDDTIYAFAKDCGEIRSIRWLTDRETGDFKGCGFVDFHSTDGVDAFVKLRGQTVMGRPIRIDYSAPRPPRD